MPTEPDVALPLEVPTNADPVIQLRTLRRLLAELIALGVRFRLSGADVIADGAETLPATLQASLHAYQASGLLWSYLGGDAGDAESLDLLDHLGVEVHLVETRQAARAAVRELIRDLRQHRGPLGIDIETAPLADYSGEPAWVHLNGDGALSAVQPISTNRSGLSPHLANIATMQLYAGGTTVFVLRGEARNLVLRSHWLRRQWLVAHNATFELAFLRHHTADYRRPAFRRPHFRIDCTMQLAGLVLGIGFGGGRSLANAAKEYFGVEVPKVLRMSEWRASRLSQGQLSYAAADAVLTRRLFLPLVDAVQANHTGAAYEIQRAALPAVAAMELRGLLLDRTEHARQAEAWSRELAEARQQYHEVTGQTPPSTPNEVRAWLSTVLTADAVAQWPHTENNVLSIAGRHLQRLTHIRSARPVLAILAHEKLLAAFGTRLASQINPATGRLHAHYNVAGAKSGRFTCSNPNLQQLPNARAPEFKRCIIAAPGNVLVSCDWNQVELRAAAWLAGDAELTALYADGRDLHRETAATIACLAPEDVTREQRQAAKAVNFGSIYGISARGLAEYAFTSYGIEMTEADAKRALDAFFQRFVALDRWRRENADLSRARGFVRVGAGRVVEAAWEPSGRLTFQQCCNLPVQGICADAMLRAVTLVHSRFVQVGIRGGLVATVHDELLAEVIEVDAKSARHLLQQAMVDAFAHTFPGTPTNNVATATIGRTWAETRA
jgi:DNA polymerase I-like protein with 3'-5' exonuclease and polymerase domains